MPSYFKRTFAKATETFAVKIRIGHPWTRRHTDSILMSLTAIVLFGTAVVYGLNNGMDRRFPGPMDTRAQQIAAAISETAYHLHLRYAAHAKIIAALREGGMSDVPRNYEPLGLKYPDYIFNGDLWNELLNKVARLEGVSGKPSVKDGSLGFLQAEDFGIVDFYTLSFRIFGYNIQGFFKTYFILLGIGIFGFFLAFWPHPGTLLGGNFLLFGLFLSICSIDDLDSMFNGRFMATLAILPTFHLAMLSWAPPRLAAADLTLAALQVAMLAFVITIRGNALWGFLFLITVISVSIFWTAKLIWSTEPLKSVTLKILTWPVLVILLGFLAFNGYHKSQIHPAYMVLDELMPEHYFWHSLAYGLNFVDDIDDLIPGLDGARGDSLPTALGNLFMKRIIGFEPKIPYSYSNFFPDLGRPRSYERVVRAAYLDFVKEHPFQTLYLTVITKPWITLQLVTSTFIRVIVKRSAYFAALSLILVAATRFIMPRHRQDVYLASTMIGGMALAASLPSIIAYPAAHSLGDAFAVYTALVAAFLLVATPLWVARLFSRI